MIQKNAKHITVAIIGAGPAGMAVADRLYDLGIRDTVIFERQERPGGVLPQCIHDGFGLSKFSKNITGPEYAEIYKKRLAEKDIELCLDTSVMSICGKRIVTADAGPGSEIYEEYEADVIVMATGCRERGRGNLGIPGTRPAGIFTAGTAQAFINLHDMMPGKEIVILGSGDIGLIMARRLTLEGAEVKCVVEMDRVAGGLKRNVKQCLEDFEIPLMTKTTVSNIHGTSRVVGVDIAEIDDRGEIIVSTERYIPCDTLILSAGLVPENTILEPEPKNGAGSDAFDGIFFCGNALYVHGLADDVSDSGEKLAEDIAEYLKTGDGRKSKFNLAQVEMTRADNRRRVREKKEIALLNAGRRTITCILCPNSCEIDENFQGGKCDRGAGYAREEMNDPKRVLTSSVKIKGRDAIVSVRTGKAIPKKMIFDAMKRICRMSVQAPVRCGDVICSDFMVEGTDLIATSDAEEI